MLDAKFTNCAARALTTDAAARLLALLWRLDEIDEMAEMQAVLRSGCRTEAHALAS
jgi:hypothetical protein